MIELAVTILVLVLCSMGLCEYILHVLKVMEKVKSERQQVTRVTERLITSMRENNREEE